MAVAALEGVARARGVRSVGIHAGRESKRRSGEGGVATGERAPAANGRHRAGPASATVEVRSSARGARATHEMTDADTRRWVRDAANGDVDAAGRLTPLVYEELRRLARHYLSNARSNTLQPTALVHEAYLKLAEPGAADPRSLTHFRAIASVAMRHVLVDHARGAQRQKRGGDRDRVTLSGVDLDDGGRDAEASVLDAEELDAALARLATEDARAARVVELRFFGGLTEAEIAALLGVTERTVRNDWRMARAWLRVELGEDDSAP